MSIVDGRDLLFWSCISGVAYTYVIYPYVLLRLARKRDFKVNPRDTGVKAAVVFAAYNEEKVIGEKLQSLVSSDFAHGTLEVLVGDDASTDRTAEIVREFAAAHPFIRLVRFGARTGKPAIVNELVKQTTADVLILTDANIIHTSHCLQRMLNHFNDPKVSLVAANVHSRRVISNGGISIQEDAYVQREIKIKRAQSVLSGVVIAPFGACYAVRRRDYHPVPRGFTVDDFYIAMHAQRTGGAAIQDVHAICLEDVSHSATQEFRRKVRISRGNFQNLATFWSIAARPWTPLGFHFVSHKVLRWVAPALIMLAAVVLIFLAVDRILYRYMLPLGLLIAMTPIIDRPLRRAGRQIRVVRFAAYFLEMNAALVAGFAQWVMGHRETIWQPTQRAPLEVAAPSGAPAVLRACEAPTAMSANGGRV